MAASAKKGPAKDLTLLSKTVSDLGEKLESLDIHEIRKVLEEKIITNEKTDIAENVIIEEVIDKYFVDFLPLRNSIIKQLDTLKSKSKDHYYKGFRNTYVAISHFIYQRGFTSVAPTSFEYRDPAVTCMVALIDRIGKNIFIPLQEELFVNRAKDFDLSFDLPESFNDLTEYIVKALYEIELMLNGKIKKMPYYNIPIALEKFNSLRFKFENNPKKSFILLQKFWDAIYSLDKEIEASQLDEEIYSDGGLESMWNDMGRSAAMIEDMLTEEERQSLEPKQESVLDLLQTPTEPALKFGSSEMNYLEIILKGYLNENNRKHLVKYFVREFKKAEKEHYETSEFYSGCLIELNRFESSVLDKLNERKRELYFILNEAKNRTINFGDSVKTDNYERSCIEMIEYCNEELMTISENDFPINLASYTQNRFFDNVSYSTVLYIKNALNEALKDVKKASDLPELPVILSKHTVSLPLIKIKSKDRTGRRAAHDLKESNAEVIVFGYSSDNTNALLNAVKQLQLKIDLLDEVKTSTDDFLQILLSKNLKKEEKKIYLNCETVQFAYVVFLLSRHFHSLTAKIIGESGLFYSSNTTQINAQYLYESKRKFKNNPVKKKDDIDKILKGLLKD